MSDYLISSLKFQHLKYVIPCRCIQSLAESHYFLNYVFFPCQILRFSLSLVFIVPNSGICLQILTFLFFS